MTDRMKKWLFLSGLLVILLAHYAPILFTHKIIRAPDIINEFYWGVKDMGSLPLWKIFRIDLSRPGWDLFVNSGYTTEGGDVSLQFLLFHRLLFWLVPPPASVAWYIVLQLFIGAAGIYCFCRLIGTSRWAALLGGLIFALAPENASLINAGHVMKIATISFAPWAFFLFEKGFQTRRPLYFMAASVALAYQFFHTHWQIAYYTCLAIGVYGIGRSVGIIMAERTERGKQTLRLLSLNALLLVFFLSTVAISLVPLANWSKDTNRGVNSGANASAKSGGQPKGGLDRDEAMLWSLPPEEVAAFVIPGMFGFSRQEAGENPSNIGAYYWGRMAFTQTVSYMGLLPWLLLPLPLIFRRDKYTWLGLAAVVLGILFSMGKYTPFYNFLFDHFPGINRFRVPKMMMFVPVMGLGVLAARGLDLLLDESVRASAAFRRFATGVALLPAALLLLLVLEVAGRNYWIGRFVDMFAQPTRYEQGPQLIFQRWNNLVAETAIAAGLAAACAGTFWAGRRRLLPAAILPGLLLVLFLVDVGRVNSKFMFLVDEPHRAAAAKSPEVAFLAGKPREYRVLPMDGTDPMRFAASGIPVMFTSNAVQQRRWQELLDAFTLSSSIPDMLNVKYLVMGMEQYDQEKAQLGEKFQTVFQTPDGAKVVLENRGVLPKAWLVPSAVPVADDGRALGVLRDPQFDPRRIALVETQPPLMLSNPRDGAVFPSENARVTLYEGERIRVAAKTPVNALLVLGEKYYRGWTAAVDGKGAEIVPVNHVLRGVYLTPGEHEVEFLFDPLPFKVGKWLTLASLAVFAGVLGREAWLRRKVVREG